MDTKDIIIEGLKTLWLFVMMAALVIGGFFL